VANPKLRAYLEGLPLDGQQALHGSHPDHLEREWTDTLWAEATAEGVELTEEEQRMTPDELIQRSIDISNVNAALLKLRLNVDLPS
jgi:hypothetical protein